MRCHSSVDTSSLNEACRGQGGKGRTKGIIHQQPTCCWGETGNNRVIPTYLQNIDALPCYLTVNLVFVVKMPSEHLGRLIYGVFDLHRNTSTSLRLLDELFER